MKNERQFDPNLAAIKATPKTGNEHLTFHEKSVGYSLLEFWKWSVSDMLSNATRGRFAEFVVGSAVGLDPKNLRDEWDAYDLKTDSGIKIEIKSAAYIQSWRQKDFSLISFSIKKAKSWDANNGMSRGEAKRHADLYVFCLLKMKDQKIIDPLKLEQWEFYVVPTYKLNNYTRSEQSITLKSLQKIAEAVNYDELKKQIEQCYLEQTEHQKKSDMQQTTKAYNLFISHAWREDSVYSQLEEILNNTSDFAWRNFSKPNIKVLNKNSAIGRAQLRSILESQIKFARCVLIMGGMLDADRVWIEEEIEMAQSYNIPIIGIYLKGQTDMPLFVKNAAKELVSWNTNLMVDAIRRNAI